MAADSLDRKNFEVVKGSEESYNGLHITS